MSERKKNDGAVGVVPPGRVRDAYVGEGHRFNGYYPARSRAFSHHAIRSASQSEHLDMVLPDIPAVLHVLIPILRLPINIIQ